MENTTITEWGSSTVWALTDFYSARMLYIKKGFSTPFQYHESQSKSFVISRGRIKFHWFEPGDPGPRIQVLAAGEHFDIPAGMTHKTEAIDDTCIFVVSTPELDDVVFPIIK